MQQKARGVWNFAGAELHPGVEHRGDEFYRPAQAVQLGDEQRGTDPAGVGQRFFRNGPLVVPTAFDLDVLLGEREAAALAESATVAR